MRIITGKLKGRQIPIPETGELRPTADRTKEAIFSVIAARRFFEGCRVLDLFAGSGNLGFEAISRGADHAHFVDQNREHVKQIEKLAESFGIGSQISTAVATVEEFLGRQATACDLVFSDPPYEYGLMKEMIATILEHGWLRDGGWFILEHDKRHDFAAHPHCFYSKSYGRTIVSMFRKEDGEEG